MKSLQKITDDVFVFPFDQETDFPNVGFIRGEERAMLVDAGCGPKTTEQIHKQLAEKNLPLPEMIAVTHYHWDHSFGCAYMVAVSVGSEYTNRKLTELRDMNIEVVDDIISDELMPEFCREHILMEFPNVSEIKIKALDQIISESEEIDLGGKTVVLIPVVSSHSEGSVLVHVKEDRVLFIGDADCGYIVGTEFVDDFTRLREFAEVIRVIDCDYIVEGHAEVYTKKSFMKQLEDRFLSANINGLKK